MKKKILFLFLLFSSISFSQNIRFEGTVKDTTGVGLEMANIMAINKQTKANYQKKLRLYILPELGKYKISSLTPPLLQKFINKLYDS